jgi:hypothetical protein
LVFAGVVAALLATEGAEGIGRDEAQYMRAGERYWGWFEELGLNLAAGHARASFTAADIDRYWSDNAPDHPVIMKALFGLSWRAFHTCTCTGPARWLHPIPVRGRHLTLPLFARESTAFRFPAILMSGLLAWLVFRFALGHVHLPLPIAVAGAALAIAQPHYFFHAPIACFDAPITTMAFAVGFAYWKSLTSRRWGVLTGLVFGVALGVKHNAWLMPIFLGGHYLWMRRGDLLHLRRPPFPLAFASMALLGPAVFLLHWPWLWHHPIDRTRSYINRHLQHEHYNFEYLGLNWNLPPTDLDLKLLRVTFPVVSTALTVPVTTLALAGIGALELARRRRRPGGGAFATTPAARPSQPRGDWRRPGADVDTALGAFLFVQTLGPLAVLSLPSTPIFGGVKHFLPGMPYLAVVAAIGLATVSAAAVRAAGRRAGAARFARVLPAGLALLVSLPGVIETRRSLPDGLSHYNMLAGGFAGGASLGMNRQFWAYCVLPMLGWVNEHSPENRRMYWHDVLGDALNMYKREGRLSMSVGDTGFGESGVEGSAMGIIVHEKHWALYEKFIWDHYGTLRPTYVRTREGVPLVTAYERPQ